MKFSVIVPVYNVAQYLPACIASVAAQTCGDYELILVDDGSTDESGALCDQLAQEYHCRVIHQENGGLGAARNTGIEAAKGDYLVFLDSDDFLSPAQAGNRAYASDSGASCVAEPSHCGRYGVRQREGAGADQSMPACKKPDVPASPYWKAGNGGV